MAKKEKVTLRNTARRPLTFRVAGQTLRLSPGERVEVPESWLGSGEVRRFCGAGLMAAEGGSGTALADAAGAESEPDESGTEQPKGRTRKPKDRNPPPEPGE